MQLTEIPGIGPKTAALFEKVGVKSCEELLRYYPIHYDAYLPPVAAGAVTPGAKCAVRGVIARAVVVRPMGRVTVAVTEVEDPTGKIRLTWYNAPFMRTVLKRGQEYVFRGTVAIRKGARVMEHPEVFAPDKYEEKIRTLVPVYGLTKGLTGNTVSKAVRWCLDHLPHDQEYLPEEMVRVTGLLGERQAVEDIHFPKNEDTLMAARDRLVFDEFFLFILAMRLLKESAAEVQNAFPMEMGWEIEELIDRLPYRLTAAQDRVWHEVEADLGSEKIMSRLIQGDVGSGKTVIAFLAMIMASLNGYQSALMAPTEVLARQHYEKLCKMKTDYGLDAVRPVLLTGSLKAAERRAALKAIESGEANCVIGTHALIQTGVTYRALSLVITDEQHRFGVYQRKALTEKGAPPNMMVMSATPIPRTLGVIYYGDLDISVIDELPARRLPIKNAVVGPGWRPNAWKFIRKELEAGHQAYVICPMIEANEEIEAENVIDYSKLIAKEFPDHKVAMLHGRMKPEEKNKIMAAFAAGEVRILVSTTVVEVGVDVPNATVMLIENAERFGLATLHQLRGRVGRGDAQSYCIFLAGQSSEDISERLTILSESNNGFEIAEKDFELRGPGDLMGIRQSGEAMFRLADVSRDRKALTLAGRLAADILHDDPALLGEEMSGLKRRIRDFMAENEGSVIL